MEKIYGFTNENISEYQNMYDFCNKSVLSVIGSGDQYFNAILNGAKDTHLYDINIIAWYHFVLKYMAIKYLSYEEFCSFFFTNNLHDVDVYLKLRDCLPKEVKDFFDNLVKQRIKFSSIKINQTVFNLFSIKDFEKYIPYLKEENYYKLQGMLLNKKLPKCFIGDIFKILSKLEDSYDLVLLSNIYAWCDMSVLDYKSILDKTKIPLAQAMYYWHSGKEIEEFTSNGFTLDKINAIFPSEVNQYNYCLTYRKNLK